MPKFPEPPSHQVLEALGPDVHELPRGFVLWRVYFRGGTHPADWLTFRHYGPVAQARFDHHLPPVQEQERAIFYAAEAGLTALAEVFQRRRAIDRSSGQPWLAAFAVAHDLALLDLTGLWPTAVGASTALCSGPRPRARRWSQAIYAAYPNIHGLWYPSSMAANAPAVALYERAGDALPPRPLFHRPLDDPALVTPLRHVARQVGYVLL